MTHKELEALAGRKIDSKVVMYLLGDGRMFRRLEDGTWEEYDLPPAP